jgi:hypothetical protein
MRGIEYQDQAEQVTKLELFVGPNVEKDRAVHAVIVAMHLRAIKEAAVGRTYPVARFLERTEIPEVLARVWMRAEPTCVFVFAILMSLDNGTTWVNPLDWFNS